MNLPANPHHDLAPSDWVVRFCALLPATAQVLDLAAGRGRHARYLAARGARVTAVDRDADVLAELAGHDGITTRVADLEREPWPFGATRFDAIVVVHYLHRPLLPCLAAALAPQGVLLYETFARGNEAYGRPRNPDFLLAPGELLAWATQVPLTVVAFEQGRSERPDHVAVVQRLAAVGSAYPWPPRLPAACATGASPGIG